MGGSVGRRPADAPQHVVDGVAHGLEANLEIREGIVGVLLVLGADGEAVAVVLVVGLLRVFYFENNSQQLYCSSADWMERNLLRRIEIAFPILKKKLSNRILEELEMYLTDCAQSWELQASGEYIKCQSTDGTVREGVQTRLLNSLATHANAPRL